MTEQTQNIEAVTETEEAKAKTGRPAKGVKVKNNSGRLITLIATKTDRVSILPTETKELPKAFMAEIKNNVGAMSFFESGELVEV